VTATFFMRVAGKNRGEYLFSGVLLNKLSNSKSKQGKKDDNNPD